MPKSVAVISTNTWARDGIRRVAARFGIEQTGEAIDLTAAKAVVKEMQPSLVVADLRLRSADDVAGCRALRELSPASRLMTLSWYGSERDWLLSLLAGASACLVMQVGAVGDLIAVIGRVAAGENLIIEEHGEHLDAILASPGAALSEGDLALFEHVCALETDSQIAAITGMSAEDVSAAIGSLVERISAAIP